MREVLKRRMPLSCDLSPCPPLLQLCHLWTRKKRKLKLKRDPPMEIQVYSPRDCPVGCPGWQSAQRSAFPWLNFYEGAEAQSQWEPGKSGYSWWLPPTLPSLGSMKPYNHTTLISPRMEGVVMATEHFLKHRNGVHYCSVSLAVAKRSVWQLFSIWILAWERNWMWNVPRRDWKMVSAAGLYG